MSDIKKLEAEIALVKLFLNGALTPDLPEEFEDDISTLLRSVVAKISHLEKSIRKYGHHTRDCHWNVSVAFPCNCGFSQLKEHLND